MSELKYKVGDKVTLTNGKIMTIDQIVIDEIDSIYKWYKMKGDPWNCYTDDMIECKVEEETKPEVDYVSLVSEWAGLDIERSCILNEYDEYQKAVKEHGYNSEEALTRKMLIYLRKIGTAQNVLENFGFNLPEDYVLKDENGNVIDTHKIVLEKKKKAYPKTFEECVHVLEGENRTSLEQMNTFRKLIDARNAYWKLYGEEMGLDKPWEPDWYDDDTVKYCIIVDSGIISKQNFRNYQFILAFPTEEMRDTFKDNFDPDIEICKELL